MPRITALGVGAVLLVGLIGVVPTANADGPPDATTVGPVVAVIDCDGESITRTERGWYEPLPEIGNPGNYHLTWTYSTAEGKIWTYVDTGVIRLYERDGELYVSLSGHSVNVGPDGTGWIGHFVADQQTGDVWRAGLEVGDIDQLACSTLVPAGAAEPTGTVVVRELHPCIVGWDEASTQLDTGVYDQSCLVMDVRQPGGTFTQVLKGQIPVDQMDAFRAAGSPTSYAPSGCLVNYGWLMRFHQGEDWGPLMVFTSSVRHFTPDGAMTEVCAPSTPANVLS
jgi:hypothetical protein